MTDLDLSSRADYRSLTEEERVARALAGGGEPTTDFGASRNPYVDYLALDGLLSLQHPRTSASGEPAFLILHQVTELLLKLTQVEVTRLQRYVEADDLAGALWVFRRLRRVHSVLLSVWESLSSLSPAEYAEFRDQLGDASAFQSYTYRHVDFLLGNKNPALVELHRSDPAGYRRLRQALAAPSLYDSAIRTLRRRGLPVPDDCVERDWADPYRERDEVAAAWRLVYEDRRRYGEMHGFAEALIDLAYDIGRWRAAHVLVAERLIGGKVGTGGSRGVRWLRRIADHRFFPELWSVRAQL